MTEPRTAAGRALRPRNPYTEAGRDLARQSLSKPVTIDQILDIEDEAAELAGGLDADLRESLLAWVRKQRATPWSEGSFASRMTGEQGYDAALEELEARLNG